MQTAWRKAYAVLGGTLISIDRGGMRASAGRPYYISGRHKWHGLNVRVLTDPPAACSGPAPPYPARSMT